jgi:single-stranded-DNA-specific exonuclease
VQIANQLVKYNTERQKCEKSVLSEAMSLAQDDQEGNEARVIVLAEQGWHPGVLGIVASRMSERLNRPAIIASIDDYGHARGSVRAPSGYNMLDVLQECDDLLETWGGHPAAAGLQFRANVLEELRDRANLALTDRLPTGVPEREINVDGVVSLSDLNDRTFEEFDLLAPFGVGNPEPVLELRDVQAIQPKRRGRNVRMRLRQGNDIAFGTGFGLGSKLDDFGSHIDVLVSPRRNSSRHGKPEVYIKDVRAHA